MSWWISWTCPKHSPRTPSPRTLMTSSTSPRRPQAASSNALRWTRFTSGLFDSGLAGAVDPNLCPDNLMTMGTEGMAVGMDSTTPSASELFQALEHGMSTLQNGADCGGELPVLGLDQLDDAPFTDIGDDDVFCEEFTDLSEFLFGNVVTAPSPPELTLPNNITLEAVAGKLLGKRPAESETSAQVDVPAPNPDHDDYVCKAKRPRVSSSASSMASIDHEAQDHNSKYFERRRKNNIASRRSRETRKMKYSKMEERAIELEKTNADLRRKGEELERLTKIMKETLVRKLSGRV